MKAEKVQFSKVKFWFVVVVLFVCGAMVGVGVVNLALSIKNKQVENTLVLVEKNVPEEQRVEQHIDTSCQAVEKVLVRKLWDEDSRCEAVQNDIGVYKQLIAYGCPENQDNYMQLLQNKSAILMAICGDIQSEQTCKQIEQNLQTQLPDGYVGVSAEQRIERAKIYSVMAERGCPENATKYVELAKKELDIARAMRDDNFSETDTIEVVETYKRLKMQKDAEEIFDKVKKLTNPAIDFIMQVEKIVNE